MAAGLDRPGFEVTLKDGRAVFLAPVMSEDAWRLQDGLTRMSAESRYLRFFSGFTRFSDEQVRYFTEIDHVDHVAWGAMRTDAPPWPGVAIARFARLTDDPRRAEWAVAIVDDYQRGGLGTVMLAVLYLDAEARGVEVLTALVLPENRFVLRWLINLGATIEERPESYVIELPVRRLALHATDSGQNLLAAMERVETDVLRVRSGMAARQSPGP